MLKMNKKSAVAMALVALMCLSVAYASFTVFSNEAHVKVAYTVSLTASLSGSTVTLTAHLESCGNPVGGAIIDFYVWDGASWSYIGSASTNGAGNAVFNYGVGGNGDYDFKAFYTVP